ncbi:MAG: secretin N-terminal domain-containing protein [Planctomycetaceae bacterium]
MTKFTMLKPLFTTPLATVLLLCFAAENRLFAVQEAADPAAENPATSPEYPSNIEELKGQIFRLHTEIAVLRQQLGPDHPKMKQAETRLQVFEELYDEHQKHAAAQAQAQESDQLLSVLTLQRISATNAERVIRELYPTEQYSLAADERTNTLIIRANGEFRELVAALIGKLDETAVATDRPEPAKSTLSKTESKPATAESVAQMKQQASDLDLNAQKFASDVKSHLQSGKGTAEEIETLKRQLRDAVTQSFDARQQLKRTELQLMEARLQQLQLSIELREQLRSKMIDRRVEELLGQSPQVQ